MIALICVAVRVSEYMLFLACGVALCCVVVFAFGL